jgi:guanine deaminase
MSGGCFSSSFCFARSKPGEREIERTWQTAKKSYGDAGIGYWMTSTTKHYAIIGTFFHAPTHHALEVLEDVLILVENGEITAIIGREDPLRPAIECEIETVVRLPQGSYGLPGLVDIHVHAPQYPQLGLALDEPLEIWLDKYTFPLEAEYADLGLAAERYSVLVDDFLCNGTTTAVYFATQHREATELLADICISKGQRALVGKVVMDNPATCPETYRDESPEKCSGRHARNH